jgi:hypothetical protein
MDPATFLKRRQQNVAQQNEAVLSPEQKEQAAVPQLILVISRDLTAAEKKLLNKNFPRVIPYDAGLNSSEMDLSKMAFDLLCIDSRVPENQLFLEIIHPSASALGIPITLLKRKFCNGNALAEALGAYVIKCIEDIDGPNFFLQFVKKRLPKLQSRWVTLLKKLFALLVSSA